MVTGDSQEEVIIFRDRQTDRQTLHHNIYIISITTIFTMFITITTIPVSPSPPPMKMQVAVEFRVRLRFSRMTGTSQRDST